MRKKLFLFLLVNKLFLWLRPGHIPFIMAYLYWQQLKWAVGVTKRYYAPKWKKFKYGCYKFVKFVKWFSKRLIQVFSSWLLNYFLSFINFNWLSYIWFRIFFFLRIIKWCLSFFNFASKNVGLLIKKTEFLYFWGQKYINLTSFNYDAEDITFTYRKHDFFLNSPRIKSDPFLGDVIPRYSVSYASSIFSLDSISSKNFFFNKGFGMYRNINSFGALYKYKGNFWRPSMERYKHAPSRYFNYRLDQLICGAMMDGELSLKKYSQNSHPGLYSYLLSEAKINYKSWHFLDSPLDKIDFNDPLLFSDENDFELDYIFGAYDIARPSYDFINMNFLLSNIVHSQYNWVGDNSFWQLRFARLRKFVWKTTFNSFLSNEEYMRRQGYFFFFNKFRFWFDLTTNFDNKFQSTDYPYTAFEMPFRTYTRDIYFLTKRWNRVNPPLKDMRLIYDNFPEEETLFDVAEIEFGYDYSDFSFDFFSLDFLPSNTYKEKEFTFLSQREDQIKAFYLSSDAIRNVNNGSFIQTFPTLWDGVPYHRSIRTGFFGYLDNFLAYLLEDLLNKIIYVFPTYISFYLKWFLNVVLSFFFINPYLKLFKNLNLIFLNLFMVILNLSYRIRSVSSYTYDSCVSIIYKFKFCIKLFIFMFK